MARRASEVRRAAGRRRLRVLVAGLSVLGVAAVAAAVAESSLMAVHHVRVSGEGGLPAARVVADSGVGGGTLMIHLDSAAVERRLDAVPDVASAVVVRQWPTTVRIALVLRTPVAVVGAGSAAATVDATGRVLSAGATAGLPILTLPAGVAVPGAGGWLGGVGSPAGVAAAVRAELDLASAVPAGLGTRLSPISVGAGGLVAAYGATTVDFGGTDQIGAQVRSLQAVLAATPLGAAGTLDLTVPSRPVLTPAGAGAR